MSEPTSAANSRALRRLEPRHVQSPLLTTAPHLRPRISSVKAACTTCRKHKAKCSGERPTCRRCLNRHALCVYTSLPGESWSQARTRDSLAVRDRRAICEEIFDLLRKLPDQDAKDVLQRIRSGIDPAIILNNIQNASLLIQMAVLPETRLRYELPLSPKMPKSLTANNPYLDSLIYESVGLSLEDKPTGFAGGIVPRSGDRPNSGQNPSPYLKPFHAAQVVEPQLSDVKISSWTSVCNDDRLMRELLLVFLRCEYHFAAAFQKDLFLQDMAAGQHDFCSSLLVNIVLAYACVCYPHFSNRAEYWVPQTWVYRFLAEARRLWELESSDAQITTIQAGILFTVFHNLCGLDNIGKAYRIQAVALANQLRLFDRPVGEVSERVQKGTAFTAWTLYNWETLTAFSFMQPPLLQAPPDWPLSDASDASQWYGEIWTKYPLEHGLSPSSFGHVFRARCQFRIIMNEFCTAAYTPGLMLAFNHVYSFCGRLRSWYNSLPAILQPKAIVLPGHLQLHIYYHHLILTMCEPLLDLNIDRSPTPNQLVADAKRHMQTLVRLYYLRHGFEAMDLFIVIPLMLTGYDCVDTIDAGNPEDDLETLRSTLILVAQGLHGQRRNHYLAEALFRVLRGRMRPQEAALLTNTMSMDVDETNHRRDMVQAVRSNWPVSVVKKKEDVDGHLLTHLVRNYAHLNNKSTSQ